MARFRARLRGLPHTRPYAWTAVARIRGARIAARRRFETSPRMRNRQWQDAVVVDLHIHGVSEPTRRILSAEARARGESLQEYLLDLLDHEARDIDNRGLLAEWTAGSMEN